MISFSGFIFIVLSLHILVQFNNFEILQRSFRIENFPREQENPQSFSSRLDEKLSLMRSDRNPWHKVEKTVNPAKSRQNEQKIQKLELIFEM